MQRVCRIFGMPRSTAYYLKAREATPPERLEATAEVGFDPDAGAGHMQNGLAKQFSLDLETPRGRALLPQHGEAARRDAPGEHGFPSPRPDHGLPP